jgi:hypothetical protein
MYGVQHLKIPSESDFPPDPAQQYPVRVASWQHRFYNLHFGKIKKLATKNTVMHFG